MQPDDPVAIVRAWHEAVNDQAVSRLVELSHPDIEILGPRGAGRGHQLLRDWLARANITLTPLRVFARDDVVVVAQRAAWRSAEGGAVVGEADIAARFRVDGRRITHYARYDSLAIALDEAGLGDADECGLD